VAGRARSFGASATYPLPVQAKKFNVNHITNLDGKNDYARRIIDITHQTGFRRFCWLCDYCCFIRSGRCETSVSDFQGGRRTR
jgi:hypothetical protein